MKGNVNHKVLFIGDIHGNDDWKKIAEDGLKRFYEIVFLGDYVDSFYVKPVMQMYNLKELIEFKKSYSKNHKITLLLGNHDFAYINQYSGISGYQFQNAAEFKRIFQENINEFDIAWGYTDAANKYTLATHGGLTRQFWNGYILPLFEKDKFLNKITDGKEPNELEIHETLNYLRDKGDVLWKVGSRRGGAGTPSPLWADYEEVMFDAFDNINQVFGHTPKSSVSLDHYDDNFYACVDSWGNKVTASLIVNL